MRSPVYDQMSYFDFGTRCTTVLGRPRDCNQYHYGRITPPRYNLSRIAARLALFTGEAQGGLSYGAAFCGF